MTPWKKGVRLWNSLYELQNLRRKKKINNLLLNSFIYVNQFTSMVYLIIFILKYFIKSKLTNYMANKTVKLKILMFYLIYKYNKINKINILYLV